MGSSYLKSMYKRDVIKRVYRIYGKKDPKGIQMLIDRIRKNMDASFIHDLILGGVESRRNLQLSDSRTSRMIAKQIWDQLQ